MQALLDKIRDIYDRESHTWTGCNWTTQHGATMLDLDGYDSATLRGIADKIAAGTATEDEEETVPSPGTPEQLNMVTPDTDGDEYMEALRRIRGWWVDDLRSGADWLETVESAAATAEAFAAEAMAAVDRGDLAAALTAAESACSFESEYGDDPTWGDFQRAIEAAIHAT